MQWYQYKVHSPPLCQGYRDIRRTYEVWGMQGGQQFHTALTWARTEYGCFRIIISIEQALVFGYCRRFARFSRNFSSIGCIL